MEKKMFYGASNLLFEKARALRNNMTQVELVLWEYLRQRPLGFKFRRQHPLGIYIVDFYCHKVKLVIEVDGNIHDVEEVKMNDVVRQKQIEAEGITVMRFSNDEVLKSMETVIQKINILLTRSSQEF